MTFEIRWWEPKLSTVEIIDPYLKPEDIVAGLNDGADGIGSFIIRRNGIVRRKGDELIAVFSNASVLPEPNARDFTDFGVEVK